MGAKARNRFRQIGSYTGTWDQGSTLTDAVATTTVGVPGAQTTDAVLVTVQTPTTGIIVTGYVSATGVVTIRGLNTSAGTIDPASTTLTVIVFRP